MVVVALTASGEGARSVAVHERLRLSVRWATRSVGLKHGQWIDTVLMQRRGRQRLLSARLIEAATSVLDESARGSARLGQPRRHLRTA